MTGALMRRGAFGHRHRTHGEEHHVKTEAEIGAMYLEAKECQGVLAATRAGKGHGTEPPSESSEGSNPANILTLDF
jgi:hypothetical protein